MDTETFWRLIETARRTAGDTVTADYDERMAAALKAELVQLPADEIMDFDNRLVEVRAGAQSPDMEAAAHLVSNIFFDGWHGPRYYCFMNGVMLLGRDTWERAAQSPDSLAEHPAIQAVAAGELPRVTFIAEKIYNVASAAYCDLEGVTVNDYLGRLWGVDDDGLVEEDEDDNWDDVEDDGSSYFDQRWDKRWKARLPGLMTLFGLPGQVNYTDGTDKLIKSDGTSGVRPASVTSKRTQPPEQTDDVFDAVLGQQRRGWWRRGRS